MMNCEESRELPGVTSRNGQYSINVILQSIFSAASRRETLGEHSKGRRRDGGLKCSAFYGLLKQDLEESGNADSG
jgi:hypothetical protein